MFLPESRFNVQLPNNNNIIWNSDVLKAVVEMCIEHYIPKLKDTFICVDFSSYDYIMAWKKLHPEQRIIFYNLEHKYPLDENGDPYNSPQQWNAYFKSHIDMFDEIWDFNIENYGYFDSIGFGEKFRFMPLRYTKWFEQFRKETTPRYDLEFEGIFTRANRLKMIMMLTCPIGVNQTQSLKVKIANTPDPSVKYDEKQDARYCIDYPQYDHPETINSTRIHECICMNRPVIVCDLYKVGSRKYWDDLCIYLEEPLTINLWNLTRAEPRKDVAEVYKNRTYTDESFQQYRKEIKEDFEKIENIQIPDFVLQ